MELFVIHCTTCRARLKVRSESAIGEILACPKCGSMVQVAPPPDWKPAGDSASVNAAAAPPRLPLREKKVREALATAAAIVPTPPVKVARTNGAAHNGSAVRATDATAGSAAPVAPPPVPAPAVSVPPIENAIVAQGLPSMSSWGFLVARVARDKWLFGGASAAGIAIGVGVWVAVVSQSAAVIETPARQVAIVAKPQPSELAPKEIVPTLVADEVREPQKAAAPIVHPDEPPAAKPQAEAAPLPPEEDDALAGAVPRVAFKPEPAVDPRPADVVGIPQPSPAPATPAPIEEEPVLEPAPPSTPLLTPAQIENQLGGRMLAIEFTAVPLGQFVEFLSGFSTLPIVLDREALTRVGKGAASPVTVNLARTTVAEALRTALAPHGLAYAVHDGRVVITAPPAR